MEALIQKLKDDLTDTCHLLEQSAFFSFTPEESQHFAMEGKRFLDILGTIEGDFLTIGLLGGTGVGKSTLMNALAGTEIAATSDRRPHTDRVLVYKHATISLPSSLSLTDVPWQAVSHRNDTIQNIILCDLPDFDSIVGEHRQHVLYFLEHLDILLWVTSPEKYADRKFYDFLQIVPKAKQNFYFVLNKVDQLFGGQSTQNGYEALEHVKEGLQNYVQRSGIGEPVLFALSAQDAFEKESILPWNQFRHFRQQILQQRHIKEITAIKTANLDVEIRQFLSSFQKESINLKIFEQILETSIKDMEEQQPLWMKTGQDAISLWLETDVKQRMINQQGNLSCLTGFGYGIALVFEAWQKRFTDQSRFTVPGRERSDVSHLHLPEEMAATFKRKFEWLEETLHRRVMVHNLPDPFRVKIGQTVQPATLFNDLKERLLLVIGLHFSKPSLPVFRLFKAYQQLVFGTLFLLFILAIGGEAAWRQVIGMPGWQTILGLLLSMVHTLFSAKGLAALGSFLLLSLLLGFRFYHRYRKRLKHALQKIIKILDIAAMRIWQEKLEEIVGNLTRLKEEIQRRIVEISNLQKN